MWNANTLEINTSNQHSDGMCHRRSAPGPKHSWGGRDFPVGVETTGGHSHAQTRPRKNEVGSYFFTVPVATECEEKDGAEELTFSHSARSSLSFRCFAPHWHQSLASGGNASCSASLHKLSLVLVSTAASAVNGTGERQLLMLQVCHLFPEKAQ